jgi:hypothetical protein
MTLRAGANSIGPFSMPLTNKEKSALYRQRHPEKAKARVAAWRAENPEQAREAVRSWNRRTNYGRLTKPEMCLLQQCRKSANKRGQECTITAEHIAELLIPMRCSVTGMRLSWEFDNGGDRSQTNPRAPSIDRIDSTKGYTPDNVQVVCWVFNRFKGNLPDAVARELLAEMVSDMSLDDKDGIQ